MYITLKPNANPDYSQSEGEKPLIPSPFLYHRSLSLLASSSQVFDKENTVAITVESGLHKVVVGKPYQILDSRKVNIFFPIIYRKGRVSM